MENKKIIALDIDGVIADIQPEFAFRLKRDFGIDEDPYLWESYRPAIQYAGIVSEEWVTDQLNDVTFWRNVVPREDAWHMMNKWFMQGHDVYIITARGEHHKGSIAETEAWLDQWELNYNRLYHSQRGNEKYKVCLELEADFLVEDNVNEAKAASENGVTTYLLDHVYNRNQDIGQAIRVASFYELDKEIVNVR